MIVRGQSAKLFLGVPAPLWHYKCGGSIVVDMRKLPAEPASVDDGKPFEAPLLCSRCKTECHWQSVIMEMLQ